MEEIGKIVPASKEVEEQCSKLFYKMFQDKYLTSLEANATGVSAEIIHGYLIQTKHINGLKRRFEKKLSDNSAVTSNAGKPQINIWENERTGNADIELSNTCHSEPCKDCSKGACSSCDGAGKKSCPDCHGHDTCEHCGGNGRVTCGKCGGSGEVKCSSCNGRGTIQYRCSADGCNNGQVKEWYEQVCHDCDGFGQGYDKPGCGGSYFWCKTCEGTGREKYYKWVDCDECGGRGYTTERCDTCNGHGVLICGRCDGKGKLTCGTSHGDGKCHTCKSTGKVTCKTCGGDGKCTTCHGSGTLNYVWHIIQEKFSGEEISRLWYDDDTFVTTQAGTDLHARLCDDFKSYDDMDGDEIFDYDIAWRDVDGSSDRMPDVTLIKQEGKKTLKQIVGSLVSEFKASMAGGDKRSDMELRAKQFDAIAKYTVTAKGSNSEEKFSVYVDLSAGKIIHSDFDESDVDRYLGSEGAVKHLRQELQERIARAQRIRRIKNLALRA